jgi:hypothetical protein
VAIQHGISITDACLGWEEIEGLLNELAAAITPERSPDLSSYLSHHRYATVPTTVRRSPKAQNVVPLRSKHPY